MLEQAVKLFTTLPAPVQAIITSTAAKLGADLVKALGSKGIKLTKPEDVEKVLENAVTMFAKDMDLKDTENEGILRDFLGRKKVRKELVRFSSSLDKEPNITLLKAEFEDAGYVEEQMPGFEFEKGIERFIKALDEASLSNAELRDIFKAKTLHQILEAIQPSKNLAEMEKKYREQIASLNKHVDSRGIAQMKNIVRIELDEIYVPLKAKTEISTTEPWEKEEEKRERHEKTPPDRDLSKLSDFSRRGDRPTVIEKTSSIEEILGSQQHVVILGDPGSGKTTVLKYLARKAALNELPEEISDGKNLLPILLPVRDYSEARSKNNVLSITKYFAQHLEKMECPACMELLHEKLKNGECLLLFDGLDEVREVSNRNDVVNAISHFLNRYSNNRFVLTSRIIGYSAAPMIGRYPEYILEPFGLLEIEKFVGKWSWAMENIEQPQKASKKKAEENAKTLFEAIKTNDRVTKLATNPLMCTVIGLIHHQGQKLPNRRIELYNICTDTFIDSWDRFKWREEETKDAPDARDVRTILEQVGLWIHQNREDNRIKKTRLEEIIVEFLTSRLGKNKRDAEKGAVALINLITERTGILSWKGKDEYGFMHLTFQEYFAACALTKKRGEFIKNIGKYLRMSRWREVILLAAARMGEYNPEDSSELIQAILDADDEYEQYLHHNLLLAGWCLADDVAVEPNLQDSLLYKLEKTFIQTNVGSQRQAIARILRSMEGTRSGDKAYQLLWDWSSNKCEDIRGIAVRSLGHFGRKEKRVWERLLEMLKDEVSYVRSSAASALGSLGVKEEPIREKLLEMLKDDKWNVRYSAARALGSLAVKERIIWEELLEMLKDKERYVRSSGVRALGSLGVKERTVWEKLLEMLEDKETYVRSSAVRALGSLGVKEKTVWEKLLEMLKDKEWDVRSSAARALGLLGVKEKRVWERLLEMLKDKESYVRSSAASALGSLGVKEEPIWEKLLEMSTDEHEYVRFSAASALGSLGVKEEPIWEKLLEMLKDNKWNVRYSAVRALGSLGVREERIWEKLLEMLKDNKSNVRSSAARALGLLGVKEKRVWERLLEMLKDEESSVRSSAVSALSSLRVKDKTVWEKLLEMQMDMEWDVRSSAARALGLLAVKEKRVWENLLEMSKDEDQSVRYSAASALGSLGVKQQPVLEMLLEMLKDESRLVSSSAYDALVKLTME